MHDSDSVEIYAREWKFQQRLIDGVAILGVGVAGEASDVCNLMCVITPLSEQYAL